MTVRIVQPSIDQSRKMLNDDRAEIFGEHLRLTALPPGEGKKRPDIIVWPETSVPFILTQNPDALAEIAKTLQDGQVLFTGAVRMEDAGAGRPPRYYNSVYAIDSQGEIIGATDKVHLTPLENMFPSRVSCGSLALIMSSPCPGLFSSLFAHAPDASIRKDLLSADLLRDHFSR